MRVIRNSFDETFNIKKMRQTVLYLTMILLGFSNLAISQDTTSQNDDFNRWQLRLRGIVVTPDEGASIDAIGGDVDISTTVVPEFDITYFLNEHWSLELILATTNHDVEAVRTAAGNLDLGDVWLLPPTLTAQYHFTGGDLVPYVGAGPNLTIFYGADEGPIADNVDYDTSVGFALQAGFDFMLNDKWFLNLDVKKLFLSTDATIDATTALGATVGADVDIDPWIIGFGIGVKL